MVARVPMLVALKRVGESHKASLKKLLGRIHSEEFRLEGNITDTATLTDAFAALGKASYRLKTIDKFHEILTHGTGTTLPVVTQELFELKVLCLRQIDLFHEMITAIHQQKEKEDVSANSLTKDVQKKFRNFYECSECGAKWEDEWDSMCNDHCPDCHAEIEPYKSEEIKEEANANSGSPSASV